MLARSKTIRLLYVGMESILFKKNMNSSEEIIVRIMDIAVKIKNNLLKPKRAIKAIHKHAEKCIEIYGLILENVLQILVSVFLFWH